MRPNPNLCPGHRKTTRLSTRPKASILRLRQMASTALAIRRIVSGQASLTAKIIRQGRPQSRFAFIQRKGIHELDFRVKKGTNVATTGRIVVSDDARAER